MLVISMATIVTFVLMTLSHYLYNVCHDEDKKDNRIRNQTFVPPTNALVFQMYEFLY